MIVTLGEDGACIVTHGEGTATMIIPTGIGMVITTAMVVFIEPVTTGTECIPGGGTTNDEEERKLSAWEWRRQRLSLPLPKVPNPGLDQ